ncbi:MAG: hypothetical protein HOV81_32980 [Kofleriaceae bacterium]|nr:hypothetical protein [Kofleriaceae bacterium]
MTRYELFRKRIAPALFLAGVAWIAYDTCDRQERTKATFVFDFGAAEHDVRAVEAEIWMNGQQVTEFRRTAMDGGYIGKTKFDGSLPDTDGEIRIDVELDNGEHRLVTRQIHFAEGSTVTIPLERDLR